MAGWKPFSLRKRDEERGPIRIFEYENFPATFRTKLGYVLNDWLISPNGYFWGTSHSEIQHELAKAHGLAALEGTTFDALLDKAPYNIVLDIIETLFHEAKRHPVERPLKTLEEDINAVFGEYGLGYEVHDGLILRVDAPVITDEAVKPALTLLSTPGFEGPESEFHRAVEYLRANNPEDTIAWANAAFESTMKVILSQRTIPFDKEKDTAKPLIAKLIKIPGLLPGYLSNYATNIGEVFQGLPTLRSKNPPAHGSGTKPPSLTRDDAMFAVGLAATFILFAVKRHQLAPR